MPFSYVFDYLFGRKKRLQKHMPLLGVRHSKNFKIYARDYKKRAFRIWIGPGPEPEKKR